MPQEFPIYARPPLLEATMEFRVEPIQPKTLEGVRRRFQRRKWKEEQLLELEYVVGSILPPQKTLTGYKFTAPDGAEVIQTNLAAVGFTALAPYPGWEGFLAKIMEVYSSWRKEIGSRKLTRIGVRYINRFDIPCAKGMSVNISDYLTFTTVDPPVLDRPVTAYQITSNGGIEQDNLGVNLTSATVISPLIDHVSLLLDIDIYREGVDVPQEDVDIHALLDVVRRRRTEIFEQCITPASRALIS